MSVRLFVLGVVNERDTYGYDIKATAHLWGLERWAQIRDGSIYHALGKLEEEGLIQERDVEQSENNRPRYVYCITPNGQKTFLTMLRDTLRTAPTEGRDIDIALAFIGSLPSHERVALLKERQERLHEARALLLDGFEGIKCYEDLPPWVPLGMNHSMRRIEAEITWNLELIGVVGDWPTRK